MLYALIALLSLISGAAAGWLIARRQLQPRVAELENAKAQIDSNISKLEIEKARIEAEKSGLTQQLSTAQARVEEVLAQGRRDEERMQRQLDQADKQWQERLAALRSEIERTQADSLAKRQTALAEQNSRQINELLEPVRRQFEEFKRLAGENRTASEVSRKELQNTFESTMKLFRQQQEQAVAQMREQTDRIGQDAATLTRALRGDNRAQGRWGEMVLEHILEESGLRRDHEFYLQSGTTDSEGNRFRPDVVVSLPDERSVIIDSKVSLTAYASALDVQDTNPQESERLMQDHAKSVRRHIDELARKEYASLEKGAVDIVMMFMPTDSSFLAAVRTQPDIVSYAFSHHVAIITPSNLMTMLRMVYHLWQNDRQEKNVERIVARGNELYSRMAGFMESFKDIETHITRLQKSFELAQTRLSGRGGIISQFEKLKKLGLTPKKQIRLPEDFEADDAPDAIESPDVADDAPDAKELAE